MNIIRVNYRHVKKKDIKYSNTAKEAFEKVQSTIQAITRLGMRIFSAAPKLSMQYGKSSSSR